MRTADLSYDLPEKLIAQAPEKERDAARLLVLEQEFGTISHRTVRDLPDLLGPADLVVVNDARAVPARLDTRRETGGAVEVVLLEPLGDDGTWRALAPTTGWMRPGEILDVGDGAGVELVATEGEGQWLVRSTGGDFTEIMARHGQLPLPPQVQRTADERLDEFDRERFQAVYASADGAIVAPAAGLHLTAQFFAELDERLVEHCAVTHFVGLGSLQPVRARTLDEHEMLAERFAISAEAAARIRDAKQRGKRIVAVGTSTVRALEGAALTSPDGLPAAGRGTTSLFIRPGHRFQVVDGLLTTFHPPRSPQLATVGALGGMNRVLSAYREAVRERYRLYCYGDAMLLA